MYAVAVSYLEWIRWVASGWFRCADRIVWIDGVEDQEAMNSLMDRSPDLQVSDDQGYVIACLISDNLMTRRRTGPERSVGYLWLSVDAVERFYPLSARGARLLEADAERAAVRLGAPIFENLWTCWRDRRLTEERHWRGLSLCNALGLLEPDLSKVSQAMMPFLTGLISPPNATMLRENSSEGTRAFGWAAALSVVLIDPEVRAAFDETKEQSEVKALLKTLKADFEIGRPLLDGGHMPRLAEAIDGRLSDSPTYCLPLSAVATILHYKNLVSGAREVKLSALVADLSEIASVDYSHASLCAYFIGCSMENIAVMTLRYQAEPSRYPALAPAAQKENLNVRGIASTRLEGKKRFKQTDESSYPPSSRDGPVIAIGEPVVAIGQEDRGDSYIQQSLEILGPVVDNEDGSKILSRGFAQIETSLPANPSNNLPSDLETNYNCKIFEPSVPSMVEVGKKESSSVMVNSDSRQGLIDSDVPNDGSPRSRKRAKNAGKDQ